MNQLKTKTIVFLFSILTVAISTAQITNNNDQFNGIKIDDSFKLTISQNETSSFEIVADNDVKSKIKTEVKDGVLNIIQGGRIDSGKPITINVAVKSLTSLTIAGTTNVTSANELICNTLFINSYSTGNIYLDVKASEIITRVNNIGDVTIKGSTHILDVIVSGAGDLKAFQMAADTAKVNVSGSGNAKISVKHSLEANITGTGSIIYTGKPEDRNISISGNGSVRESKSGNEEVTANDTAKIKIWKKKYMIIPDDDINGLNKKMFWERNRVFKNWTGIEFGINGLLDYKNCLDPPSPGNFIELNYQRSMLFGLNLLEKDFHLYKNYLKIITGLGFDFNHYSFQKNIILISTDTSLSAVTDSAFKYKKNSLNVSYLKVPIMLEVNTSKDSKKNTHVDVGVEFACRIHSVAKQNKELNDKHYRIKEKDDFNLQPFRVSGIARIGFNNITVFANYGLGRLFKKNRGPQVYPFSMGIAINFN